MIILLATWGSITARVIVDVWTRAVAKVVLRPSQGCRNSILFSIGCMVRRIRRRRDNASNEDLKKREKDNGSEQNLKKREQDFKKRLKEAMK